MTKLRIVILPFAILAELLAIAVVWLIAVVSPAAGERFENYAWKFFPDGRWYWPREGKK